MIASYAAAPSNHSQLQLIVTHTYRIRVLNTEGTKHSYHKNMMKYDITQISHRYYTQISQTGDVGTTQISQK